MYTNDLLEEKYKAQRQLSEEADKANKDYLEFIEAEVKSLYAKKGWKLRVSKRRGGFLGQSASNTQTG